MKYDDKNYNRSITIIVIIFDIIFQISTFPYFCYLFDKMQLHLKYTIIETLKYKKSIYFADSVDIVVSEEFCSGFIVFIVKGGCGDLESPLTDPLPIGKSESGRIPDRRTNIDITDFVGI